MRCDGQVKGRGMMNGDSVYDCGLKRCFLSDFVKEAREFLLLTLSGNACQLNGAWCRKLFNEIWRRLGSICGLLSWRVLG